MVTTTDRARARLSDDLAQLLIEGRAVQVGGQTIRFYPSLREVARRIGRAPSTVKRWADRGGLLAARDQRLEADRIAASPTVPTSFATIVEEILAMVRASCQASGRPLALRQVATVLRLVGLLTGVIEGHSSLVRELEAFRRALLRRAGRRR